MPGNSFEGLLKKEMLQLFQHNYKVSRYAPRNVLFSLNGIKLWGLAWRSIM